MLDDHCYKAFIAKFAAKGFSLGCYFFLLVCVCVCVPALRVCCSLCLVIVAGIVCGLVCPHICCAWIGWDWGRCCFGVCVVCVGCLSRLTRPALEQLIFNYRKNPQRDDMICGNACVCITRCDMWKRRVVNQHHQQSCTYVVGGRVGLNTGYITGVDMCKVCTDAVQSVALWTRVTLQVWTCVKYVLKQSSP